MEEKYRALFEEVHASRRLKTEVMNMTEKTGKRRSLLRPVLVAAVLAVALTGTVLAAGTVTGFDFVKFFAPGEKTSLVDGEERDVIYEVGDDGMIYFPAADLPQEVRDAAEASGGEHVFLDKTTWSDVEKFLGMELPFSTVLEERGQLGTYWTRIGDGPEEKYRHCVEFDRELKGIWVHALYRLDQATIMLSLLVKTDAIEPQYRGGTWYSSLVPSKDGYVREDYLTAAGVDAVLVSHTWDGSTLTESDAFFTLDGIGYNVRTYGADRDQVLAVLKDVLDGF